MSTTTDKGTYQMLWDCPYCGTDKLLGLSHRHCPACGAAQDEDKRYFPADEDKVAVEDHKYSGADKDCPACSTPNAAIAVHCVNCGSPMDGAAEVSKVSDEPEPAPEPTKASNEARKKKKKKGSKIGCIIAALIVGAIVMAIVLAVVWKKPVTVEATARSWERSVAVEVFTAVPGSAWCDEMPSSTYDVRRTQEVRSEDKVADGQTCTTKRRDNGDGSFTEYEDCKTKYKTVPVYADKCSYKVDKWTPQRTEKASGGATEPTWPDPKLTRTGNTRGSQREGARTQKYVVTFRDADGKTSTCKFPQDRWAATAIGSRYTTKAGVLTGGLDCSGLVKR